MAKRKRITLIYSYNEGWIAGSYYIQNLIQSLKNLPIQNLPIITLYANDKDFDTIRKIEYPFLKLKNYEIKYNLFERIINKISRKLIKRNFFEKLPNSRNADIIFPLYFDNHFFSLVEEKKRIYWIPDFQEHYLPAFFSNEEIENRKQQQQIISQKNTAIVFSSEDALRDFKQFYPQNIAKTFVMPFTVTHPDYEQVKIQDLLNKYDIEEKYFFSPNQFWQHKNHIVVLEALKILKENNIKIQIVFTGKEEDYRNPNYFSALKSFINQNNLTNYVKFLGFIDRKEQLQLMNHSLAVIQPSLFEGWSTVVEDVKAMNQFILLSDLKVHREQTQENVIFFDPRDYQDLANKIINFLNCQHQKTQTHYKQYVFGEVFLSIVSKIVKG